MAKEIRPTDTPLYFVARSVDGSVLHAGVTMPGQVTTTGQAELIAGTEDDQVRELEKFVERRPSKQHEFDSATRSWKEKGTEIIAVERQR